MSTTENKFFSSVHRRGRATTHRRDAYLRRFQLLGYREVMRLCDVMETEVPIHGAGNFPTLNIRPCKLVQVSDYMLSSKSFLFNLFCCSWYEIDWS